MSVEYRWQVPLLLSCWLVQDGFDFSGWACASWGVQFGGYNVRCWFVLLDTFQSRSSAFVSSLSKRRSSSLTGSINESLVGGIAVSSHYCSTECIQLYRMMFLKRVTEVFPLRLELVPIACVCLSLILKCLLLMNSPHFILRSFPW
jgi:hypothetical protein